MSLTKFYPSQLLTASDASELINNQITSDLITHGVFNYTPTATYSPFDYVKDKTTGNIFICKKEIPPFKYALDLDSPNYLGIIPNSPYYAVSVLNYKKTQNSTPVNGILILDEVTPYAFIESPSSVTSTVHTTFSDSNTNEVLNTGLWFSNTLGVFNIKYNQLDPSNPFILSKVATPSNSSLDDVTQIQVKNGYIFLAQYGSYIYYTTSPLITPRPLNIIGFWSASLSDSSNSPYVYFADSGSSDSSGLLYFLNCSVSSLFLSPVGTILKVWKAVVSNLDGGVYCSTDIGEIYRLQKNSSNVPTSLSLLPLSPVNRETFIEQKTIVDYESNVYFIGLTSVWSVSKDNNVASITFKDNSTLTFGLNTPDGIPYFFSSIGNYVYKITNISQTTPSYISEKLSPEQNYINSVGLTPLNNISCPSQYIHGYLFYITSQTFNVTITSNQPDFNDTNYFGLIVNGNTSYMYGGTLGMEISMSSSLTSETTMCYIPVKDIVLTLFNPALAPKYTIGSYYKILCKFSSGNCVISLPDNVKLSGKTSMTLNPYDSLTLVHDGINFYIV